MKYTFHYTQKLLVLMLSLKTFSKFAYVSTMLRFNKMDYPTISFNFIYFLLFIIWTKASHWIPTLPWINHSASSLYEAHKDKNFFEKPVDIKFKYGWVISRKIIYWQSNKLFFFDKCWIATVPTSYYFFILCYASYFSFRRKKWATCMQSNTIYILRDLPEQCGRGFPREFSLIN